MKLGICTIQRDRARWLPEWFCFHYLVGFRKFYFYAHKCRDNTSEVIARLATKFDIQSFSIADDAERPQLASYHHAYSNFGHLVDWMAFIDGDEFLFPVEVDTVGEALDRFDYEHLSALAVHWAIYGSGGHLTEPDGLIIDNFRARLALGDEINRHIKSIVRGRQGPHVATGPNAHLFSTIMGTFDEQLRPVTFGKSTHDPSHRLLRINHYTLQSWEFFKSWKQTSGAADGSAETVRSDAHFHALDRRDATDDTMDRFIPAVTRLMAEIG